MTDPKATEVAKLLFDEAQDHSGLFADYGSTLMVVDGPLDGASFPLRVMWWSKPFPLDSPDESAMYKVTISKKSGGITP